MEVVIICPCPVILAVYSYDSLVEYIILSPEEILSEIVEVWGCNDRVNFFKFCIFSVVRLGWEILVLRA